MREIVSYEARDGQVFLTRTSCLAYERELDTADRILSMLKPKPDLPSGTYIQQDVDAVWNARKAVVCASKLSDSDKAKATPYLDSRTLPNGSMLCRYLDDVMGNNSPLVKVWWRLECCDAQGRDWQQPYFAMHPEEGKGEYQG